MKAAPKLSSHDFSSIAGLVSHDQTSERRIGRVMTPAKRLKIMLGRASASCDDESRGTRWRRFVQRVEASHSSSFSVAMSAIILASAVNVGLQIECEAQGADECGNVSSKMEYVFCAIFVGEIAVRYAMHGRSIFRRNSVRFDTFLVCISAVSLTAGPFITAAVPNGDTESWLAAVSQATLVRALRLFRLVRFLRLFRSCEEMWKLARGLMSSLRTVMAACLMIVMTIYVFACFGMELLNHDASLQGDPDTFEVLQLHFSSLRVAMLTLIQFATGDGILDVYWPIVNRAWYLVWYFMAVWLVLGVVLMNLVTHGGGSS
ncbi:unnamed protein product [Prorocentrum cordatum]|uniref:Ion transport domain-containing protein n=1 Tax=Prorocentrum cordatum TaxID=2364126 RepID=A0ABN9TGL0_9DINO|nr:unnamed protein product [Polarella glacialis]